MKDFFFFSFLVSLKKKKKKTDTRNKNSIRNNCYTVLFLNAEFSKWPNSLQSD